MNRIGKFEKVSYTEYNKARASASESEWKAIYEGIRLPVRATEGSAGYDFFSPYDIKLNPGETITIPTGIRAKIDNGWVLMLFPRSGLGFKFRLQLDNTVGVIDSDYYNSENEGHIFCKITNCSLNNKTVTIEKGKGFCQGVFLPYGITEDDTCTNERNGGFGSTDKK